MMIEIQATIPKSSAVRNTIKHTMKGRPTPIFKAVVAARDEFWGILVRKYLRARNRSDKKRLMRDTGATSQSYFPGQKDGQRPIAFLDSKSPVARIHEDTGQPRVMVIRAKDAKALFIPTVNRSVAKGVVPSTSGASTGGGGRFIFRPTSRVTRRWPSHHALKKWERSIVKVGAMTFERELQKRWEGGPPWPREQIK